jgi:tetratricopeptide (TPR) repeat protein
MMYAVIAALVLAQDHGDLKKRQERNERESEERLNQHLRRQVEEANARLKKDANDVEALVQRGLAFEQLDEEDKAMADLKKAIDLNPKHVKALIVLGDLLRDEDKFEEARALLTRAIELQPNSAQAYAIRGEAFEDDDRLPDGRERALEDYNNAVRVDPTYVEAFIRRAGIYEKQKKVDEARADVDKALDQIRGFYQSTYPELLEHMEQIRHRDVKEYRKAVRKAWERYEVYRDLKAINPEEFELVEKLQGLEHRAEALARKLPNDDARAELRRVLGEIFDLRQAMQNRDLDVLQKRIDTVRAALKEQAKNKDVLVEERLRDMEKGASEKKKKD